MKLEGGRTLLITVLVGIIALLVGWQAVSSGHGLT